MKVCPNCGDSVPIDDQVCANCGLTLGTPLIDENRFNEPGDVPAISQVSGEVAIERQVIGHIQQTAHDPDVMVGQVFGNVVVQSAPRTHLVCEICRKNCPIEEVFTCEDCEKAVCISHRDKDKPTWCRLCAQRLEIVIVHFQAIAGREYEVVLEAPDLLESEIRFTFTFDEDTFERAREASEYGRDLLTALSPDNVSADFFRQLHSLYLSGARIQFRLADIPPALMQLPWEYLCWGDQDFWVLSSKTPVVRCMETSGIALLGPTPKPLQVLVIANDNTSIESASSAEIQALSESLLENARVKFIACQHHNDVPTWLGEKIVHETIHILHISGEFVLQPNDRGECVVLSNGTSPILHLDSLGNWLEDSKVQVVLFMATVKIDDTIIDLTDPELKIYERFLRGSTAIFITCRAPLDRYEARDFAATLYSGLALDKGIETAIANARRILQNLVSRDLPAWSLPVVFQRPIDGTLLEFVIEDEPDQTNRQSFERFIEEDLITLSNDLAPTCLEYAVNQIHYSRLIVITGEIDATPLTLTRLLARRLVQDNADLSIWRFPRYENSRDFLPNLRAISHGVILYDMHQTLGIGEEMQALYELVEHKEETYVLISTSELLSLGTPLGQWLSSHPEMHVHIEAKHYQSDNHRILKGTLEQIVQTAQQRGNLNHAIGEWVLNNANEMFEGAYALKLPGEIERFIYHYGRQASPGSNLKPLLKFMDNTPRELKRWFGEALDQHDKALVMVLALFQGMPVHILSPVYRLIVKQLRDVFYTDVNAHVIVAQVGKWSLYLTTVRHRSEASTENLHIEFLNENHREELLHLLREEYSDWLASVIPVLSHLLLTDPVETLRLRTLNDEHRRMISLTVARGFGEIALCSQHVYREVITELYRLLEGMHVPHNYDVTRSSLQSSQLRMILTVPGYAFRIMLTRNQSIGKQVIETVEQWWSSNLPKVRWAVASAYGKIARIYFRGRFLTSFNSLLGSTRAYRTDRHGQGQLTIQEKDGREVRRAFAYALREMPAEAIVTMSEPFVQLAEDEDMEVRRSVAIALNEIATQSSLQVKTLLHRWITEGVSWGRWWTSMATLVLLYENQLLPDADAALLLQAILDAAPVALGKDYNSRVGKNLVWAASSCLNMASSSNTSPLERTFRLMGKLLGTDFMYTDILTEFFREFVQDAAASIHSRTLNALFTVLREWTKNGHIYTSHRFLTMELYLLAGRAKWRETIQQLRILAQAEGYDYRRLCHRSLRALPLSHLGVGGTLLLVAYQAGSQESGSEKETFKNLIPIIRELAMIKDEAVRSISCFVMVGLSEQLALSRLLDVLRVWLKGPQVPLICSVIDILVVFAQNTTWAPRAFDMLFEIAKQPHPSVLTYLRGQLMVLRKTHLLLGNQLLEKLNTTTANDIFKYKLG